MMTPKEIANLVSHTARQEDIEERQGLLTLRGDLSNPAICKAWIELRANPPSYLSSVTIYDAETDSSFSDDHTPTPEERFRIALEVVEVQSQMHIFFGRSLSSHERKMIVADNIFVADMDTKETFTTYRSRLQAWSNEQSNSFIPYEPFADPRTFANDFTSRGEVPTDIRPWLLLGEPERRGDVFRVWVCMASRRLLAALSDRVSLVDNNVLYHFGGPPACAVSLTEQQLLPLHGRLQECAAWIFPDAKDAETRHLLVAAEWARTYRKGGIVDLGDGSLESARAAYAAYVKAGSKEMLKALADLRKSVVDECQKATQKAQDLAGAMWKDLAISALPFAVKAMPESTKAQGQGISSLLALGAAAYLIFSFSIQVHINKRYFRNQDDSRAIWKKALYLALPQAEIDELAENPIKKSINDYRSVRGFIGLFYFFLILLLLLFAISNSGIWAALQSNPSIKWTLFA